MTLTPDLSLKIMRLHRDHIRSQDVAPSPDPFWWGLGFDYNTEYVSMEGDDTEFFRRVERMMTNRERVRDALVAKHGGSSHDQKDHGNWADRYGGVQLHTDPSDPNFAQLAIGQGNTDGGYAAELNVRFDEPEGHITIGWIEVDPAYQRQGLAMNLVREALNRWPDLPLNPGDTDPTDEAEAFDAALRLEFADYIPEYFAKHGDGSHDEKDHGNWSRGSHADMRLAPLKGDVKVDNVKYPGWVSGTQVMAIPAEPRPNKNEVPLAQLDHKTAPSVGLSFLPEATQKAVLLKAFQYGETPSSIFDRIQTLAEDARDFYATADPATREWDRFYERWHVAFSSVTPFEYMGMEVQPLRYLNLQQAAAVAGAISPSLTADPTNFLYTFEIDAMLAANPAFTAEQAEIINAKFEVDGIDVRVDTSTHLLDLPDGESMARAAGELRRTDAQWRLYLPENEVNFGVGRTWQNFAKGFDVAVGNRSIDDALNGLKIRSFYNNIVDPLNTSRMDDVTVDFQTIDLAFGMTGSSAVTDFTSSGAWKGVEMGVRPLVADMVRRLTFNPDGSLTELAQSMDIQNSAQMQEVLWAQWKRVTDSDPSVPTLFGGRDGKYSHEPTDARARRKAGLSPIPTWVSATKDSVNPKTPAGKKRMEELWIEYQQILGG